VPVAPATFLLGGTVSGMADGVSLTVANGSDSVTVSANGSFALPTRLAGGIAFNVTATTPAGHVCSVSDGAGTIAGADVSKVVVKCSPFVLAGKARPFTHAYAMATDAAGATYVLDTDDQVVIRVTRSGATSVFAGTRNVRGHQDGGPGTGSFYVNSGSRMAFDPQGNLILTDTCNGMIRKISPEGVISTIAGHAMDYCSPLGSTSPPPVDGVGTNAVFLRPQAVAVDGAGNIVIATSSARLLRRINVNGVVTTEDPLRDVGSVNISALAFNARNQLYLSTNSTPRRIWRVDGGNGVLVAGGGSDGNGFPADQPAIPTGFNNIRALAADKDGTIYIADEQRIRKLTTAGIVSSVAGTTATSKTIDGVGANAGFSVISAIVVNSEGNLSVLQSGTAQLRLMTPVGAVSTSSVTPVGAEYADGKGPAARFAYPDYLASAPDGAIFTIDNSRHVIRKIGADGTVSVYAGIAGTAGATDGPVASAMLDSPVSLAVDKAGTVFFIDRNGLRKIAGGVVTTIKAAATLFDQGYYMRVMADGGFALSGAEDVRLLFASGEVRSVIDGTAVDRLLGQPAGGSIVSTSGIETDAAGNLYLADSARALILKYSAGGVLSVFAGTFDVTGYADGAVGRGSLSFETPGDLAIDAAGNLYLSGQGPVRKISPQGVLSTPVLAWGRPNVFGIAVNNGMLYGSNPGGVLMQTPLP
jgi:hypothetical protein